MTFLPHESRAGYSAKSAMLPAKALPSAGSFLARRRTGKRLPGKSPQGDAVPWSTRALCACLQRFSRVDQGTASPVAGSRLFCPTGAGARRPRRCVDQDNGEASPGPGPGRPGGRAGSVTGGPPGQVADTELGVTLSGSTGDPGLEQRHHNISSSNSP